eukprot:COSAG01_NODE_254_length_20214_cov_25.086254_14_plen_72_part_00
MMNLSLSDACQDWIIRRLESDERALHDTDMTWLQASTDLISREVERRAAVAVARVDAIALPPRPRRGGSVA